MENFSKINIENLLKNYRTLNSVYFDPFFSEFGKPCDALLKTDDGTEFKVHSKLLSRGSRFFKTLFSIKEEPEKSTVIHGIDPNIFEILLIYLCTGRNLINTENMMRLLVASDFLMACSLSRQCKKFVLQNMTVDNSMGVLLTAERIKRLNMADQCRRLVAICFERAVKQSADEVSDLPLAALKYFLGSRSLNVSGERPVWSLIETWVLKDPSDRMRHVPELLRHLSVSDIDDELASEIASSPIIRKSGMFTWFSWFPFSLYNLVFCNRDKFKELVHGAPLIDGLRQPRRLFFVTRAFTSKNGVEMFVTYDDRLDVWRKLGETSDRRLVDHQFSVSRVGHRLYITESGYVDDEHLFLNAFTYDLLKKETTPIALPTLHYRREVRGRIYALGNPFGFENNRLEVYVDQTDEWVDVAPMHQTMVVREAASLNGLLYAIGTTSRGNAMQVYDPSSDKWTALTTPVVQRISAAMVVHRGRLFLIGGVNVDDNEFSGDVEVYDSARDEWNLHPEIPVRYDSPEAVEVNGRVLVYSYLGPVSVTYLDDESGLWIVVEDIWQVGVMRLFDFYPIDEEEVVREIMKQNKACHFSDWLQSGLENVGLLK